MEPRKVDEEGLYPALLVAGAHSKCLTQESILGPESVVLLKENSR